MNSIRPLTEATRADVEAAMTADKHPPVVPTHVITREEIILGTLSLNILPLNCVWMNTQKASIRDSMFAISAGEAILADRALRGVNIPLAVVPVVHSSPFYKYVEKLGYKVLFKDCDLFYKQL